MKKIRLCVYIFNQASLHRIKFRDKSVRDLATVETSVSASQKPGCGCLSLGMASDAGNRWARGDVGGCYSLAQHAAQQ